MNLTEYKLEMERMHNELLDNIDKAYSKFREETRKAKEDFHGDDVKDVPMKRDSKLDRY